MDGGERAVIFDRFRGVLPETSGEGTHFLIPFMQWPVFGDEEVRALAEQPPKDCASSHYRAKHLISLSDRSCVLHAFPPHHTPPALTCRRLREEQS